MRLAVRGFLSVSPMFQPRYARAFMPAPACGRTRRALGTVNVVTEQHQALGPVRVTKAGAASSSRLPRCGSRLP